MRLTVPGRRSSGIGSSTAKASPLWLDLALLSRSNPRVVRIADATSHRRVTIAGVKIVRPAREQNHPEVTDRRSTPSDRGREAFAEAGWRLRLGTGVGGGHDGRNVAFARQVAPQTGQDGWQPRSHPQRNDAAKPALPWTSSRRRD